VKAELVSTAIFIAEHHRSGAIVGPNQSLSQQFSHCGCKSYVANFALKPAFPFWVTSFLKLRCILLKQAWISPIHLLIGLGS
jgi:hypothetical protein